MTSIGPNRPPIQSAINTAGAAAEAAKTAGAAIAKSAETVGKAAGSALQKVADTFGAAKPGAFEGIKGSASGIMAGGCCFPPPTGPLKPAGGGLGGIAGGIGSAVEGAVLRMNRDAAKDKFDKSVDDSMKAGSQGGAKITDGEQRKINSAGRDYKIADKKVELHDAKEAKEKAVNEAKAKGEITDADQKKINDAQDKIDKLQTQLKDMVSKDKMQDMIDGVLDAFDKNGSKLNPLGPLGPGIKGPGGLPEPPGGKIWDEKLPPNLGGGGGKVPTDKLPDIPGGYGGGKIFDERPPIGPGGLFPKPDWKPFPSDFKLPKFPDFKDIKLPEIKLPDIKDLPFPKLPAFPQPPVWTCRPPMLETFKPPFLF